MRPEEQRTPCFAESLVTRHVEPLVARYVSAGMAMVISGTARAPRWAGTPWSGLCVSLGPGL